MKYIDRIVTLLKKTLYIPKLGISLLLARHLYRNRLQGIFNNKEIHFYNKTRWLVVTIKAQGGLYKIRHIAKPLYRKALLTSHNSDI